MSYSIHWQNIIKDMQLHAHSLKQLTEDISQTAEKLDLIAKHLKIDKEFLIKKLELLREKEQQDATIFYKKIPAYIPEAEDMYFYKTANQRERAIKPSYGFICAHCQEISIDRYICQPMSGSQGCGGTAFGETGTFGRGVYIFCRELFIVYHRLYDEMFRPVALADERHHSPFAQYS